MASNIKNLKMVKNLHGYSNGNWAKDKDNWHSS